MRFKHFPECGDMLSEKHFGDEDNGYVKTCLYKKSKITYSCSYSKMYKE